MMVNRFSSQNLFNAIREGMIVIDQRGNRIGTVEEIRYGEEDLNSPGSETVTGSATPAEGNSFTALIADVFAGDEDVPDEVRSMMRRYGYIRVETGLLRGDRIVLGHQILRVNEDEVVVELHAGR